MKRPPVPRDRIYDLYWYFTSQRQRAFERRVAGVPWPWTDDPIIQTFKFCNVFRAADRVSQYRIREVCYHDEPCSPEDRLFQILAFRTFSKIETWRSVRDFLGRYPTLEDLGDASFIKALEHAKDRNGGLYTGAFILCATDAYGQGAKHHNHVELFRHMFLLDALGERLLGAKSFHMSSWSNAITERGPTVEQVLFVRHRARFSRDFETLVVAWCATKTDATAITRLCRIAWPTAGAITAQLTADEIDLARLDGLYELGVDEISYRLGFAD